MQDILQLCPNLEMLFIYENIDGDFLAYNHILKKDMVYPPLLTKIRIENYDKKHLYFIAKYIKSIKEIYFVKDLLCEYWITPLVEKNKHIQFIMDD